MMVSTRCRFERSASFPVGRRTRAGRVAAPISDRSAAVDVLVRK